MKCLHFIYKLIMYLFYKKKNYDSNVSCLIKSQLEKKEIYPKSNFIAWRTSKSSTMIK